VLTDTDISNNTYNFN